MVYSNYTYININISINTLYNMPLLAWVRLCMRLRV